MSRGVFSLSAAVLGTLGTWGTRELSTRDLLALLAFAAADAEVAVDVEAPADEDEAAPAPVPVAEGRDVTGLGGSACLIVVGAAVLLEEEVELELEEATDTVSLWLRRDEM